MYHYKNKYFFLLGKTEPSARYRILPYITKEKNILIIYRWPKFNNPIIFNFWGGRHLSFQLKNFVNFIYILIRIVFIKKKSEIFIQKQLHNFNSRLPEKILQKKASRIIYDFDDAIYLTSDGKYNKKWCHKLNVQLSIANQVIAGNKYLSDYASKFNENVSILPTAVNTDVLYPLKKNERIADEINIGWVGTSFNYPNLYFLIDILNELMKNFTTLNFIVISDREDKYLKRKVNKIRYIKWQQDKENYNLNLLHIGIMPLIDNLWNRGKCGFKLIQYMSVGLATVSSPVGVNQEIISHGRNGFLAETKDEWYNYLKLLISNSKKREEVGISARKTILEKYSVQKNHYIFFKIIKKQA